MSDAVKPAHTNIDPVPPEIRKAFVTDDEVLQFMVAENYGWTRDIYLDARQTLEMPEELTPQEAAVVDTIEDFDDRRCVYESILDGCVEMAHEICAVTGWADHRRKSPSVWIGFGSSHGEAVASLTAWPDTDRSSMPRIM